MECGGGGLLSPARTFTANADNEDNDTIQIVPDVRSSNANRANSALGEPRVPSFIALRVRAKLVRKTVDLDGNRSFVTIEIEIEWTVFVLLAEPEVVGALLEYIPQPALRRRH